ncbi:oligosaccharide flippase family protein [Clostridium perfringens]|nr:oligosaccharide flippase family protein [Clostridium perfringens]
MNFKIFDNNKIKSIIYIISNLIVFILAFLINVIMTNYVSNQYVYGQYKYATNFILTIPSIFSLGITWSCASLIANDKRKSKSGIITASIIATIIIGIIVSIGVYCFIKISYILGYQEFNNLKVLVPFVSIFLLQKLVNQIYTGLGETVQLSLFNIIPNTIIILGTFLGIKIYKDLSYIYCILLYLIAYTIAIVPKLISISYEYENMKKNFRDLFDDVKNSGFKVHISSVFTTSSSQIIAMACGGYFGYTQYGYYSLASSLATIFLLIGSSLAIVNFKKYANSKNIPKKDFIFMISIGIVSYILMFLLIDKIFYIFYPKEYAPTIIYLKILCMANLIFGFSNIFNRFFISKGLGGIIMKNSFISAVATIVINIPMIKNFGMIGIVYGTFIVSCISVLIYFKDYKSYILQ